MATLLNKFKKERGADNSLPSFDSGGRVDWDKMKVNQRRDYIENFLRKKGLNDIQLYAVLGNLQQENGNFNTKLTNGIGATGIAQWFDTRAEELMRKKDYQHIDTQLNHLWEEISGNKHWTSHAGGKKAFFNAKNLKDATIIFRKAFERPGEHEAFDDKRFQYAVQASKGRFKASPNSNVSTSETYEYYDNSYDDNYNQALTDFSSVAKSYAEAMSIMSGQQVSEEDIKKRLKSEKDLLVLDAQVKAMQLAEEGKKRQMEADKLGREALEKEAEQEALKKQQEAEAIYLAKKEQSDRENASVEAYAKSFESGVKLDEKIFASSGSAQPFNFQTSQNIGVAQKGGVISEAFNKPNLFNFKQKFFQKGGTVRELYESKTGKAWSTAKEEGLTDGSYEGNLKLKESLLNNIPKNESPLKVDFSEQKDFNSAFKIARDTLGANNVFTYKGQKFGTNVASEKFEPNEQVVKMFDLNKEAINRQNKQVNSPFTSKEVVKIEPEWKNWSEVKGRMSELNKMEDAEKVISFQKEKHPEDQYVVVDKANYRVHIYKGGEKLDSYEAIMGKNKSDAQTVTKVSNGKTDWGKGNMSTGAGVFEISNRQERNEAYNGDPSFNLKNANGIEVATAFHGIPSYREGFVGDDDPDNNRDSNGCINGTCPMLKSMYHKYNLDKGTKVYILPEEDDNRFEIEDGKVVLKVGDRSKYLEYEDSSGEKQKGQGINTLEKTLNYKPIKIQFYEDLPQAGKDAAQYLTTNKKKLMKDLKINSDVYNDLTLLALGIMGQESDYGTNYRFHTKKHAPKVVDFFKSLNDNNSYNSKGLTQVKIDGVNSEVKELFKKYDINGDNVWEDGSKAIAATMLMLGNMYNNELKDTKLLKDSKVDYTDALMYLYQGKKNQLVNKTATPDKNTYIMNVKKFINKYKINLQQYM